jgi:nucleoid-associated protein YgaU
VTQHTSHSIARCLAVAASLVALSAAPASSQSLRGSAASLDLQNRVARQHDFTFIDTSERVRRFASMGLLVRLRPGRDFELHSVSFPYSRPEVALFVERLSGQYRAACGEQLVVTSLTRPTTRQPRNASSRSVHPTGMAVDLRYSRNRNCRVWLERVLTQLEATGVLEATRERYPAHYHVALFPKPYAAYVQGKSTRSAQRVQQVAYTVRSGDSLWTIARKHGTTVEVLQRTNGIRGSRIYEGQVLDLPGSR